MELLHCRVGDLAVNVTVLPSECKTFRALCLKIKSKLFSIKMEYYQAKTASSEDIGGAEGI